MSTRTYMRHERVSHSEIDSFKKCKRKFWYLYLRRLSKKRGGLNAASKGGLLHKCLEHYCIQLKDGLEHDDAMVSTHDYLKSIIVAENFADAGEVSKLLKFWGEVNPLRHYTVLAVEKKFAANLFADVNWVGAVDVILRDRDGKIVIVDFKSTQKQWSEHRIELDPQIPTYIAALRHTGYPADYGLLIQIRTQYAKAAVAADIIISRPLHYTDINIENVWGDVYNSTQQIAEARQQYLFAGDDGADKTRSPSDMVCNMCPMRMLCISDLKGDDSSLLIGSFYEARTEETGYEV